MSAGVGATPVLAMQHAIASEQPDRPVWWLHGARRGSEHPFRDEVQALLKALPNAHRVACYSAPAADDVQGESFDVASRLDGDVLERSGVPIGADFYICGRGVFMHDIAAALAVRGVPPDTVKTEIFGSSEASTPGIVAGSAADPHPPPGDPGTGDVVAFSRSNLSVRWDPAFGTLLEFAEACDVPVRWSCRTGVCHTCETGLVGGEVAYEPEPLEQPTAGSALICCSRSDGDVVLDLQPTFT